MHFSQWCLQAEGGTWACQRPQLRLSITLSLANRKRQDLPVGRKGWLLTDKWRNHCLGLREKPGNVMMEHVNMTVLLQWVKPFSRSEILCLFTVCHCTVIPYYLTAWFRVRVLFWEKWHSSHNCLNISLMLRIWDRKQIVTKYTWLVKTVQD